MSSDSPPAVVARALTEDGALALRADAGARELMEPWMPRVPGVGVADATAQAWITARTDAPPLGEPAGPSAMELRNVHGWVMPDGCIALHGPCGRVTGAIHPAERTAEIRLSPADGGGDDAEMGFQVFAAFTMAAGFLLGRLERALVHAAAVVAPGGRAWLMGGATFSGKTTTCLNLIRSGWDWLADDQVVLGRGAGGGLVAEGWPRRFNLDHGYHGGRSVGVRSRVEPDGFGPGRWVRSAPLAGLLFLRVDAKTSTRLAPLHPAGALSRMVQQSPWLLGDAGAARAALGLLQEAAGLPAFELRLGEDTYRDRDRLVAVLRGAVWDETRTDGAP